MSSRTPRVPAQPQEAVIHDLTHEGSGVTRQDGKAVFIPGALPGERVSYITTHRKRDFDQARLLQILEASPSRVTPPCPHFGICGGCSLQHLDPVAQVEFKQRMLLDNLQRIGKVTPGEIFSPILGPIWNYRRRARFSVSHDRGKGFALGFHTHDNKSVAKIQGCEVLDPTFGRRITELNELFGSLEFRNEITEVEVALGDAGAAMVLRLRKDLGDGDRAQLVAYSSSTGISIWLQHEKTQPLVPDMGMLSYKLPRHSVEIRFKPNDFIQANPQVNEAMVDRALELLELQPQDHVLELFSGLGNFTLPIARRCASVHAVEAEPGLVQRARDNAALNGITNVRHVTADLTHPDKHDAWLKPRYDKLLLDPPRAGAREVLPAIGRLKPKRLVYVSCHPGTLARDAGVLVYEHGYHLLAAGIMDMFPHTSHVESMALFAAD